MLALDLLGPQAPHPRPPVPHLTRSGSTTTIQPSPARTSRGTRSARRARRCAAQLLVHRLELLVGRLELLVHRLELLVGRLELLVRRLQLLVGRLELLVRRLELLVRGLELLVRPPQLAPGGPARRPSCSVRAVTSTNVHRDAERSSRGSRQRRDATSSTRSASPRVATSRPVRRSTGARLVRTPARCSERSSTGRYDSSRSWSGAPEVPPWQAEERRAPPVDRTHRAVGVDHDLRHRGPPPAPAVAAALRVPSRVAPRASSTPASRRRGSRLRRRLLAKNRGFRSTGANRSACVEQRLRPAQEQQPPSSRAKWKRSRIRACASALKYISVLRQASRSSREIGAS